MELGLKELLEIIKHDYATAKFMEQFYEKPEYRNLEFAAMYRGEAHKLLEYQLMLEDPEFFAQIYERLTIKPGEEYVQE